MKKALLTLFFVMISTTALAKNCEELKAEIDAKIKANGVVSYTLDIVSADATTDGKVVGTCDGGQKKIVYKKT